MAWKLPSNWLLPPNEKFYKTLQLFEHTKNEYDIVFPHITQFRNAIDIGAHIGTTTVRYAKDFKTVHAFEPIYHNELKENTKHLDNVIIYKYAVSDKKDKIQMIRNRTNSGMTMVISDETKDYIKRRSKWFSQEIYNVESIQIDECNIQEVDFIKIDTENYVYPILIGSKQTLINNSPVLQIELTQNIETTEKYLISLGYINYHNFSVDRFYKKK